MIEFNQAEADAAARMTAACEHEANEHGVCVFCGALQPGDAERSWEPPMRRTRLFGPGSAARELERMKEALAYIQTVDPERWPIDTEEIIAGAEMFGWKKP